jgi:hypothetical protein
MTANPWPEVYADNQETQRVSAGFMAIGQVAKQFTGKVALSASATTTVPLYTVTAGKTFYITDMSFISDSPAGTAIVDVAVLQAAVTIFRGAVHQLSPIEMPGMETQPNAPAGSAVSLSVLQAAGPPNLWYFVSGFEQ